jgi:hypothetical protein
VYPNTCDEKLSPQKADALGQSGKRIRVLANSKPT